MKVATDSPTSDKPSSFESFIRLAGQSTFTSKLPERCPECESKDFYKQSDFKRSIGVSLVGIASLATFVLMYMGYNWFLTWSPMLVVLFFDRILLQMRPVVAICYGCKHVFRGVSSEELEELDSFNLELYDRYKYKEENQPSS